MAVIVFSSSGVKHEKNPSLPKQVFSVGVTNHELLKQVYESSKSNDRHTVSKTKTRGEVRGGGRKPWRQKGTGRARFGSSRNPIWRGGGIAFGPRGNENYSKNVNSSARKHALAQALTLAVQSDRFFIIETFTSKDGKVSSIAKLLDKMGLLQKKVLVITSDINDKVRRSTNNLPKVVVVGANNVTVRDILDTECILCTQPSIDMLAGRIGVSQ